MLVFPQLLTGVAALYPLTRVTSTRTVTNTLHDGGQVKYTDPDWTALEWELRATGLTRDEWNAIETLHNDARGRLHSFLFLDPAGNLLARSEQFDEPEWDNSPLIGLTDGMSDPLGTTRAMRISNGAATEGGVMQAVAGPGNYRYAMSVWVRAETSLSFSLVGSTVGGTTSRTFEATSAWKRASLLVDLGQETESVSFGAMLPAGGEIDLFGIQVEPQLAPSAYRRTGAQGGVYEARFATDDLTVRARGTDIYDTVIRIVSKGN